MFIKLNKDNFVTSNGYRIFNLTDPFRFYFDRRKNPTIPYSRLIFAPNETFDSPQVLRYSVKLNNYIIARLYSKFESNFKCHSIYSTEKSSLRKMGGFVLFKSKSLLYMINEFCNENKCDDIKIISDYLSKIIKLIFDSYDFDILYTDYPGIYKICKNNIETELIDWKLKEFNKNETQIKQVINNIIKNNGPIPFNILGKEVLSNVDISEIRNLKILKKKCLFVTISNNFFAGFFRKISLEHLECDEVLPVTMFTL